MNFTSPVLKVGPKDRLAVLIRRDHDFLMGHRDRTTCKCWDEHSDGTLIAQADEEHHRKNKVLWVKKYGLPLPCGCEK